MKHKTFVIINKKGELFSSIHNAHIIWVGLIDRAYLFEDYKTVERANKDIKGDIMRVKYLLESV